MHIGELIKYHRTLQNLTMTELAEKARIAQSGLSHIEAGNRQPTFDLLEKIVKALNLEWEDFFLKEEPKISPQIRELLEVTNSLAPDKIELLSLVAKAFKK